jgi:hypothetical protein
MPLFRALADPPSRLLPLAPCLCRFHARLEALEAQARQLRERQQQVQALEASGVSSAEVLAGLLRMLQVKAEWYRAGGGGAGGLGEAGGARSFSMGAANVMVL